VIESVTLAIDLDTVFSSCSFAALAVARALFQKGAHLLPASCSPASCSPFFF
jgi:hypothetical protein